MNRRGATLIEVLVTTAIAGIVVTMIGYALYSMIVLKENLFGKSASRSSIWAASEHLSRVGRLAQECIEEGDAANVILRCRVDFNVPQTTPTDDDYWVRFYFTRPAEGQTADLLYQTGDGPGLPATPEDTTVTAYATKIAYGPIVDFELCTQASRGTGCPNFNSQDATNPTRLADFTTLINPTKDARYFQYRIVGQPNEVAHRKDLENNPRAVSSAAGPFAIQSAFFVRNPLTGALSDLHFQWVERK